MDYGNIVILTGAGISAESGIPTFRGDDGLWEGEPIEEIGTSEGYRKDPERVISFLNELIDKFAAKPNAAHYALAEAEAKAVSKGYKFTLITQNIDDLHEQAGSKNILHIHGQLNKTVIDDNGEPRPDVVLFGENPYHVKEIQKMMKFCRLFVSIGTSGEVLPAASFVDLAFRGRTVELNLESTCISKRFQEYSYGPATKVVPEFFSNINK
jgi:NAD-dependent deacetylase